ncbi:DUF6382 domain-containing protein [Paenibacillus jilunlii]|uniref:FHA domain-containing protein n=1 Tax=Paenibacillus jilunlii TaxID=682956 RepID=A0A1G9LF34_9BACL|nr:DUF6382 domain-containing protein [Paenibacillus jilunlii]KWX74198.1 hypothetical protein AML91_15635 [Paenibacillus jilunlii]SDL60486.1 FHA domain-containing protein [Paenibacillus jilunlii]
MFGLSRDFVQRDGISMLLSKPGGLRPDELNIVQARMLMNTGIPHHLRLQLKEINLQVTLDYALSRRKMLGHLLKGNKLGMSDFFGLLLQIAAGMEEGRLYMLSAEQYVLHEDYIFIEGPLRSGKVYLTYLPLQAAEFPVSAGEALKSLIMALMASVRELSGDGMQRLLHYCGEEEFTPAGLKELLAELLTDGEGAYRLTDPAQAAPSSVWPDTNGPAGRGIRESTGTAPNIASAVPEQSQTGEGFGNTAAETQKPAPWMSGYPRLKLKELQPFQQPDDGEMGNNAAPAPSAYRTYTVLGGVLADAVLWKFLYLNNPKLLWMAVCAMATLVLGVLCWLVWSGKLIIGVERQEEETEDGMEVMRRRNHKELEWDFGRTPAASTVSPAAPDIKVPSQKLEIPAYANTQAALTKGTQQERSQLKIPAPMPVEATALLQQDLPSENEEARRVSHTVPYLERVQENESGLPEKIVLNRPSFLIGRSPEVAQYVEKSEGVSRVHAEILKSGGGYILKDLDSRNGTLFQGEAMIPYKEYPLTEGAVFTIVKGCYTFRSA